jgi:hypothetical protein
MSRFIHILSGDYGEQIAEYVLQGLHQAPALTIAVPVLKRRWYGLKRRQWQPQILIIAEHIAGIEKLEEGYMPEWHNDWLLPGIAGYKRKGDMQRLMENFKLDAQPGSPRKVKQIRFKISFKDGTACIAIGDARVFQNILAQTQR